MPSAAVATWCRCADASESSTQHLIERLVMLPRRLRFCEFYASWPHRRPAAIHVIYSPGRGAYSVPSHPVVGQMRVTLPTEGLRGGTCE
jgi:hypothetical protein